MNDVKYIAVVDDHAMFRKGICALINLFPTTKYCLMQPMARIL